MSDYDFSKCPLCDTASISERRENGNIYFYHCATCTDYFISRGAAKHLQKEPHRKSHFSQVAASRKDKDAILAINLKAGDVLHPETIPRTSYPR